MTCRVNGVEMSPSHCGISACLSDAWLCIVVQNGQRAPLQLFFYNNKLQFRNLTSNQVVGSSNLSGRTKYEKGIHRMPFSYLTLPREFELCCPKGNVRTEVHEVNRQAEPRSGDEAAKLPSNLSGRAIFLSELDRLRDLCGIAKHLVRNPAAGKTLSHKIPAA